MRFYDFSDDKLVEYKRRIKRIKEKNPDTSYPSELAREQLCYEMYLGDTGAAINMAAQLGDTSLCRYMHMSNPDDVNARYSVNGNTPLMSAVERKRLGTAQWLLDHGAKILPNKTGWNPVLWACRHGCIPALNMFKHYGVDFNQPYPTWEWWGMKGTRCKYLFPKRLQIYPIMFALRQPKVLQWLIDNGASIDVRYRTGESIREKLEKHPEDFMPECKEILQKKAQKTPAPVQKPQQSFWARLGLGKVRA